MGNNNRKRISNFLVSKYWKLLSNRFKHHKKHNLFVELILMSKLRNRKIIFFTNLNRMLIIRNKKYSNIVNNKFRNILKMRLNLTMN